MKTIERKPKWAKWRLIPEVEVWQAVALSLDIEPDKIEFNRQAWMGARHPFKESEEFVDRLDVAGANILNASYFPSGGALVMGRRYSCGVRLAEFARFATEVAQWDVPHELRALAQRATTTPPASELAVAHAPAVEVQPDNPRQKRLTDAQRAEICERAAKGETHTAIAAIYGVTRQAVANIVNRAQTTPTANRPFG